MYLFLLGMLAVLLALVFRSIYRILRPRALLTVREVESWPNASAEQRRFCQEFFSASSPPVRSSSMSATRNYLVILKPSGWRILRLSELLDLRQHRNAQGKYQADFYFRGEAFAVVMEDPEDAAVINRISGRLTF